MTARRTALGAVLLAALALCPACVHPRAPSATAASASAGEPAYRLRCRGLWARHIHDLQVDYSGIAADPDHAACRAALEETDLQRLDRTEQLAFWLNAYNLLTLLELSRQPRRWSWSPRQDGGALFADVKLRVARTVRTLDQIEHGEVAALSKDPRLEFVLHCGTRGCSPLPRELLAPSNFARLVAEGEKRWFAQRWNCEVDWKAGVVYVGQLLAPDWHGKDFVAAGERVEDVVARHLEPRAASALRGGKLRLVYRTYDWRVNRLRAPYGLP